MKDIIESLKQTDYSECHDIKCIKELTIERKTGTKIFKVDTEYKASKINDNWWLIDQIGVSSKEFKKHFKDI